MKVLSLILLFTILTVMAGPITLGDQWKDFKLKHGKSYNDTEEEIRFAIFEENVKKIEEHNKKYDKGEVTYKMGINKFADLTPEEYKKFAGGYRRPHNDDSSHSNLPTAI